MRKSIKAMAIAMAIMVVPMTAFGANSASSHHNSTSNHSNIGNSTVTTTTTTGTTSSASGTAVLANGTTINVEDPVSASGVLTRGLVSSSTAHAAIGAAKRAGLPTGIVAQLDAVDAGSLTGINTVSGTTAGKQVLASTVAIRTSAGTQQQLVMDRSRIPASGVVYVLFYNNETGKYTVESATVDPSTGLVTFTAPNNGTAAVIG